MQELLNYLYDQQTLSRDEAKQVLGEISDGKHEPHQISSFLTVFKMRNITVEELTGFRDCLRERCIKIDLSHYDCIDLCGTGGDGKNTFNISTATAFILAGAGYQVAKHGNYGVSSICGSSNVLEHLGYTFKTKASALKQEIENYNITFLHAPLFHPAMKAVGPIRKALGVRTFFNMLGPMVNPAQPKKQLVGVYSLSLQRYYKYLYQNEDKDYRIIHALDGYDEVTLTDEAKVVTPKGEYILKPQMVGATPIDPLDLIGGTSIADSADILVNVLSHNGSQAQNQVLLTNAALAIQCYDANKSLSAAYEEAREALESGKAIRTLKKLLDT